MVHADMQNKGKSLLALAREEVTQTKTLSLWFSRFASRIARLVGHPYMFLIAVVLLIVWGAEQQILPLFGHLAIDYQYQHHHRDISGRISYSKHAKPRRKSPAPEA